MTIKIFREAYLATRFLDEHVDGCQHCQLFATGRRATRCPAALRALLVRERADELLNLTSSEMRTHAWLQLTRSPSRR